jgi:hypothetical protein
MALNKEAQHFIRSMRVLTDSVDFFTFEPANHLLRNRDVNEAFCMMNNAGEYLLYFPAGGKVALDSAPGIYTLKRLYIPSSKWQTEQTIELPAPIQTQTEDHWFVVLKRK